MAIKKTKGLIIAAILTFALLATGYIVNHRTKKRVATLLGDRISFEDFSYRLFTNNINFQKPVFRGDPDESSANIRISAMADQISIHGFSIWDLLSNEKLGADELVIDGLDVHIMLADLLAEDEEKVEINLFFKEIFTRIGVSHFQLTNSQFVVLDTDSANLLTVNGLSISASEVQVDTGSVKELFPLTFEESEVYLDSVSLRVSEDYRLSGKQLTIANTRFSISDIFLQPLLTREAFYEKYPFEKDQFEVRVGQLYSDSLLWSIDSNDLISFTSDKVVIEHPESFVYKDKNLPQKELAVVPLLNQLIRKIPIDLVIDLIQVKDGLISYQQKPDGGNEVGEIFFDDVYMTVYNFTNVKSDMEKETQFDAEARFMGTGALKTTIKLDMSSESNAFSVSGNLGKFSLEEVNKILTPVADVEVSGQLEYLTFNFEGDNFSTSGDLEFTYTNMQLTKRDENKDKEWLKSLVGNVMLRSNNVKSKGFPYKPGSIYFIRYQNKGFFNLLWNSIKVGLMDVIVPSYKNPDQEQPVASPKWKIEDEPKP